MFENEAKEKAKRKIYDFIVSSWGVSQIRTEKNWETVEGVPYFYQNSLANMWQEGAVFGYNKCKEELNQQGLALQSDMDKTIEQNIALKKENAELKEENTELKTKKIPQLERKIASIRGCHSVAVKKLNARIEQVERLKKENAELRQKLRSKL